MSDELEKIRARHAEVSHPVGLHIRLKDGQQAHADRATLLRAVDRLSAELAKERDGWQPIETAPRDGRYILAIGAPNDAYHIGRHAGRPFCIRYEFDLGWGVYPGYGGAPDSAFTYWKPLELPATQHEDTP